MWIIPLMFFLCASVFLNIGLWALCDYYQNRSRKLQQIVDFDTEYLIAPYRADYEAKLAERIDVTA